MANESQHGRIQQLFRICGVTLVVLGAAGLIYLVPLALLVRLEKPSGERRFHSMSFLITSSFSDSPKPQTNPEILIPDEVSRSRSPVTTIHNLKIPILETIYMPILKSASGHEPNTFAEFILGVE